MRVLISCEFGGSRVPSWLTDGDDARHLESPPQATVEKSEERISASSLEASVSFSAAISNDPSVGYVASRIATSLQVPLIQNPFSHELIDVTRSVKHRRLFPERTRGWGKELKQRLIAEVHEPYRARLRATIRRMLSRDTGVVHLSVRTFDAKYRGKPRRADVGLLYDPSCKEELNFCLDWFDQMYDDAPMLKVRRNYPRRGTVDCITKSMRIEFARQDYLGIELLLNRSWAGRAVGLRDEAIDGMCVALRSVLQTEQADAA